MRIVTLLILALAIAPSASTHAQLPPPLEPEPPFGQRPQCSRDYVRSVQSLVSALEKLRTAGPEAVGRLCALVEMGSAWLGGELPEDVRKELRSLLGVDVDLERITEQCRAGQGEIERELASKLRQLKAELARCDDTI
jgi:hypothetical protein